MGDGGSQFLGLTVGVLVVVLTQNASTPLSAALPLLLLGLPILDTLTVMAQRIRAGRSPFSADNQHLHHRLLGLGFDHFEAVAIIYLLQGVLLLLTWRMRYDSDLAIIAVFAAFATTLLTALFVAENAGWRWRGVGKFRLGAELSERLQSLKEPQRMPRWTARIAAACVLTYLVIAAVAEGTIGRDIGWLALGLAVVLAIASLQRSEASRFDAITQGALYVCMVVAVYLDHVDALQPPLLKMAKAVLFFADRRRGAAPAPHARTAFRNPPLDLLVIFVALALPNLPGLRGAPSNLGLSVAKLVVLFYAVEMLSSHSRRTRKFLWLGGLVFLGLLAVRGLVPGLGEAAARVPRGRVIQT